VWWPVAVAADTPTDRPVPVKLLGARLVLWRDASSTWRCVASACPHRGAPLETGRIDEGGHLACSYHGWAFDGADGRAVSIPQASHDSPGCGERACASRRSRAAARPTRVAAGLVWVWGDPNPAGADAAPPPVVSDVLGGRDPDTGAGGWPLTTNQQFARDFPVPYDVMVENVLDQSHVPFAHTGVASARASPWAAHFTVSDVKVAVDGGPSSSSPSSPSPPAAARADTGAAARGDGLNFTLEWSPDARSPPVAQRVRFVPPCYVEYVTPAPPDSVGDGGHPFKTALWFYVTPLDSHTTRVFNHAVVGRAPQLPRWAAAALAARPRWVDHLLLNEVFDGDLAYLPQAAANARAAELAGRPWSKYYYLPASADNAVVAWRRWFTGRGKGGCTT
jgi:phenylpropionate dioxygenase-like ring-hydroxylating dioxygenase large terminal subunit